MDLLDLFALFDLRFEGELLLLAINVELNLSSPNNNMSVCCAQEWPAQDERRLGVDFHVEHDEVMMVADIWSASCKHMAVGASA